MAAEKTVNLQIEQAYASLKAALIQKGGKIAKEEAPKRLLVKQGSLWGMSPKTAKKQLEFTLAPAGSKTNLHVNSRLSLDWKNVTLVGCAFAAVLVGLCVWMALDLATTMETLKPSFWSWLITADGAVDLQVGQAFVNLTRSLAAFLGLVILLEAAIFVYVRRKIDAFAEEILDSLLA